MALCAPPQRTALRRKLEQAPSERRHPVAQPVIASNLARAGGARGLRFEAQRLIRAGAWLCFAFKPCALLLKVQTTVFDPTCIEFSCPRLQNHLLADPGYALGMGPGMRKSRHTPRGGVVVTVAVILKLASQSGANHAAACS